MCTPCCPRGATSAGVPERCLTQPCPPCCPSLTEPDPPGASCKIPSTLTTDPCFANMKYIQPPRAQSFKPPIRYQRPCIPCESETIYNNSYMWTCQTERPPLVIPQNNLLPSCAKIENETVTSLSFPGHFCVPRQKPIKPSGRSLLGTGPMQGVTTQMHDFVPKPYSRRKLIVPTGALPRTMESLESNTINRLSYMHPCVSGKTQSFKPVIRYSRPTIPMDCDTTQKLSYMPVCPPKKEYYPWARKACYRMPTIPMDTGTVQKLSYAPPGTFVPDCGGPMPPCEMPQCVC